ncbi:hypothetical protein WCK_01239, partial [Escherichia coli KTE9]
VVRAEDTRQPAGFVIRILRFAFRRDDFCQAACGVPVVENSFLPAVNLRGTQAASITPD